MPRFVGLSPVSFPRSHRPQELPPRVLLVYLRCCLQERRDMYQDHKQREKVQVKPVNLEEDLLVVMGCLQVWEESWDMSA